MASPPDPLSATAERGNGVEVSLFDQPLTPAYNTYIHMHMRTTLILDDVLVARARRITGIAEKTALVHAGLEALIAREAARRLAALGGTMPRARAAPRRRSPRRAPR